MIVPIILVFFIHTAGVYNVYIYEFFNNLKNENLHLCNYGFYLYMRHLGQ